MMSDQRTFAALLRSDFRPYLHKVFATLAPGQTFIPSWHLDAIAWQLERVRRGEIRRLIINMPPRSLKSITASVAFPAFVLGHDPTRRIICASYSGDLAKKFSNDFRAVMESAWYQSLFPASQIGPFKNTENEIELVARGFRLATSVGGTLTGRGGDLIIIDDPLKPDDASSEAKRSAVNNWIRNTVLSRLDNKSTGAIIIVMQRVHIDDLTGFLLQQSDDWEVLNLPAIAPGDAEIPLWGGRTHSRKAGDVLSPEREPLHVLEALKRHLGGDAFSAQYQQEPAPPGGSMVKRAWIKRYTEPPPRSDWLYVMQSWDTASKGGPDNDWSVCTTWILTRDRRWYLIDVWRQQVDYPTLKKHVSRLAMTLKPTRIVVEDAGTGTSLFQELRSEISGMVPIKPDADKETRMSRATAIFESGSVYFPTQAPWLADLESELFTFPAGRHDDQCDSISQALNNKPSVWATLDQETLRKILDWSSIPDPKRRNW